jgi:hypothetical protein
MLLGAYVPSASAAETHVDPQNTGVEVTESVECDLSEDHIDCQSGAESDVTLGDMNRDGVIDAIDINLLIYLFKNGKLPNTPDCGENNHSYEGAVTTAPTCTEKGEKTFESGDLADHEWNSGVVTKEATESETGVKTYTCTECSETKTETIQKLAPTVQPEKKNNILPVVIAGVAVVLVVVVVVVLRKKSSKNVAPTEPEAENNDTAKEAQADETEENSDEESSSNDEANTEE